MLMPSLRASPIARSVHPLTFGSLAQSGESHQAHPPSGRWRPTSPARSLETRVSLTLAELPAVFSARRTPMLAMSRLATRSAPSNGVGPRKRSSSASEPTSAERTAMSSPPCFWFANCGR